MPKFLSMRQVCERTSLSRASIYRKMDEGKFPRFVSLDERTPNCKGRLTGRIAWLESEVEAWIAERIKQRSAATSP